MVIQLIFNCITIKIYMPYLNKWQTSTIFKINFYLLATLKERAYYIVMAINT